MFNRSATITVVGAGSDGRPVFTLRTHAYYFHYYNNLTKIFGKHLINFVYNITNNYYFKNYSIIKFNTINFAFNRFWSTFECIYSIKFVCNTNTDKTINNGGLYGSAEFLIKCSFSSFIYICIFCSPWRWVSYETFVNFACYFAGPIIALGQANDVVVS